MGYERRIVHFSPGPTDLVGEISERAISGCWFELHRRGGCGAGELVVKDDFINRHAIEIGDWIAFEKTTGERWYLGRVEEREAKSPAGVSYQLTGMSVELGEVFPGGFNRNVAYGVPPHRYAQTDLFPLDPDYSDETVDVVSQAPELIWLMLQQYAQGATNVSMNSSDFSPAVDDFSVMSMKFRGEESLRAVIKELALRSRDAAWGVDADGNFFLRQNDLTVQQTLREGENLVSLQERRNLDQVYNRLLLTGDYVYNEELNSEVPTAGFYRWRGTYVQPQSRSQYGDRRIRLWIPWIRSQTDAIQFVTEFFRVYAAPTSRYEVEVTGLADLVLPWAGAVRLEDRNGAELITAAIDSVRVQFDEVPKMTMTVGHESPLESWPEPEHDERWEIAGLGGGGVVTFSSSDVSSSFTSDSLLSSLESSSGGVSSNVTSSSELNSTGLTSQLVTSSELDSSGQSSSGTSSEGSSSSAESSSELSSSDASSSNQSSEGSSVSSDLSSSGGSSSDGSSSNQDSSGQSSSQLDSSGAGSSGSGNSSGLSSSGAGSSGAGSSGDSGTGSSSYVSGGDSSANSSSQNSSSEPVSSSGTCGGEVADTFNDTDGTDLAIHVPDLSPTSVGWTVGSGSFETVGGKAVCTKSGTGRSVATIYSGETDVVVTANVEAGTYDFRGDDEWLGRVGIVVRATSSSTYYAVVLSSNKAEIRVVTNGSEGLLVSANHSIAVGGSFSVSVTCQGTNITATIGGVSLSYSNATLSGSSYGLYAMNDDSPNLEHQFSSFNVNCA